MYEKIDTEVLSDVNYCTNIQSAVSPLGFALLAECAGTFLFVLGGHKRDEKTSFVVHGGVLSDFERLFNRSFGESSSDLRLGCNLIS
jgi:hypothetical protein